MRSIKKRSFCFGVAWCPSKGTARDIKYKITQRQLQGHTLMGSRLTMNNNIMSLQKDKDQQVAVVTGSSSGIGYETSLSLARNGFWK
jgi:hypothetical protein